MSREKLAGFMIIPGCAPRLSMSTLHTYCAQWVNMDNKCTIYWYFYVKRSGNLSSMKVHKRLGGPRYLCGMIKSLLMPAFLYYYCNFWNNKLAHCDKYILVLTDWLTPESESHQVMTTLVCDEAYKSQAHESSTRNDSCQAQPKEFNLCHTRINAGLSP